MGLHILIVEDDPSIRAMLDYYFQSLGHRVSAFESGEDLLAAPPGGDIALLDVMLPGMDGLETLRQLRSRGATARLPVIMLTARGTEMDKVAGLDAGADDYITKPFGVMELQARVHAVLRRVGEREGLLRCGELTIDPAGRTVLRQGQEVALTYKEFELLLLLAARQGRVCSREEILSAVWGYDYAGETRTVDMHIKALRQKLGEDCITTVRSVGYKMR